ncbi:MAG: M48 family metallopeptidase [Gammaproteobacteria bacterium]|jgi:STE24 endopeptidase|nr:M48 family metallopeptidase [Gammaproteobacteria bacterium]
MGTAAAVQPLTLAFLAAVAFGLATQLWLASRQVRHVQAHRDAVPTPFAGSVPLEAHRRAADYTVAKTRLGAADALVSAALLLALTLGGGIQALFELWGRLLEPGDVAHGALLILSVALLAAAVDLPLAVVRTFRIEARFGFNRTTPRLFAVDLGKQLAVSLVLGLPLLVAVLWLMARMGDLWWLYVWAAWLGFNLLLLLIYPTFVAPLFNRFSPLQDTALRERVERLLARCGFRAKGLLVMDGSKRSSHGNAYFTGFGAARRIVFFDTLLAQLDPPEVEAVLAHELGHFRLRHVWKRVAWTALASLALLALLGALIDQPWFYAALGVESRSTATALLLFFLAVPAFTFPLHPLASLYSRRHEYQADAYAARHAGAADLVRALVKLYRDNAATLTPDPLHSAFYDSHPPAAMRIVRLQPDG